MGGTSGGNKALFDIRALQIITMCDTRLRRQVTLLYHPVFLLLCSKGDAPELRAMWYMLGDEVGLAHLQLDKNPVKLVETEARQVRDRNPFSQNWSTMERMNTYERQK